MASPEEGLLGRRRFLQTVGALAASSALAWPSGARAEAERKRVLRIAHLTDVHVQPELRAGEGMIACLRHVQAQKDKPDLILFGGDCVMDAFHATHDRTALQWKLWKSVLKEECSLPFQPCLGNHDIWGWDKKKSGATGKEPDYGKKWAVEMLGMSERYFSFAKAGWHFIALDDIRPGSTEDVYAAYLDEPQFEWLNAELAKVPADRPILIWSHVPIISALPMLLVPPQTGTGSASVPAGIMHNDAVRLAKLFSEHRNVKLCLSGHIHLLEQVRMNGIDYYCNGAVSGNWWKGPNHGVDEGYSMINLYDDGSHDCKYIAYGWKAEGEKEKQG